MGTTRSIVLNIFFRTAASVLLALLLAGWVCGGEVHFIFTSDQHYGITRPAFRGAKDVPSHVVNAAMAEAVGRLPEMVFPADGGVMACRPVGGAEYVISAGDIANRMEGTDPAAAVTARQCWDDFEKHYINGLSIRNSRGEPAELLVVPGNHDATNAIGFFRTMTPAIDKSAMLAMYGRAEGKEIAEADFDYAAHKVFLSRDLAGVRLFVFQMWPDSMMRARLEREIAALPAGTPVILVTHIQPDIDANRLTNPNGDGSINAEHGFENLVSDVSSVSGRKDIPEAERRELARFIKNHPSIIAYFHGHEHENIYYTWTGPDGDVSLPAFMVDSPMKGKVSGNDETRVSFQSIAVDPDARRMTVRQVYWNVNPAAPALNWGDSLTFSF